MSRNPYHFVEFSPWPLTGSIGALFLTLGLVGWFHLGVYWLLLMGLFLIVFTMMQWWRDVVRESTYQGFHTVNVSKGLRWWMILFIASEVFFSFFELIFMVD